MSLTIAEFTLDSLVAVIFVAGAGYLRHFAVQRPPIGVLTRGDVVFFGVAVVVMPFAYAHLPAVVVSAILGLVLAVAIQTAGQPVLGGRPAGAAALLLVAADVAPHAFHAGTAGTYVNDAVVAIAVIGVANLWVQTGITTGLVAASAAVLALYDFFATYVSSLSADFLHRIRVLPFAPVVNIIAAHGQAAAVGLGDVLIMTVWPLALAKAYGYGSAAAAGGLGLATLVSVQIGYWQHWIAMTTLVPFMTLFGPVIVVQYLILRSRRGPGRTTRQWLGTAESEGMTPLEFADTLDRALAAVDDAVVRAEGGSWLGIVDGRVVGTGATPGTARRAARVRDPREAVVVIGSGAQG